MAPRVVHLHIGTTKTGTTFIQRVLWANHKVLAENGVTLPAKRQRDFGLAARALNNWSPADGEPAPDEWLQIVKKIERSSTDSAIISQEFISWLSPEQVKAMVATLDGFQVKVVLTTRDLARIIPAQWQSAMRQRNTWTLTEYSHAVQYGAGQRGEGSAYEHFWRRMDYGAILRVWADIVGLDNVTLVTLPQSGADPDELWRRFCAATDLEPSHYTTADVANASLGAVSCELMRRLNALQSIQKMPAAAYGVEVNGTLTRRVLDQRTNPEPKITLPEEQREWVTVKAEEMIADVQTLGAPLIGSLEDLRPRPITSPYQAPEDIPAETLLEVAIDALGGLVVAHTGGGTTRKPGFGKSRGGGRTVGRRGRRGRRSEEERSGVRARHI